MSKDHQYTRKTTRPFKKFYCDRPETFLLPSPAFKLWMYHYSLERVKRESWPSLDKMCEKTRMNRDTICKWRVWLMKHGWLVKVGEKAANGTFNVPILKVTRGVIPDSEDGRSKNRPPRRKKSDTVTESENFLRSSAENFLLGKVGKFPTRSRYKNHVDIKLDSGPSKKDLNQDINTRVSPAAAVARPAVTQEEYLKSLKGNNQNDD